MHGHHHWSEVLGDGEWFLLSGLLVAAAAYLITAVRLRRHQGWPGERLLLWSGGLAAVGTALVGPVAERADDHFVWHMVVHVLLGMLAPLLLVLAAPTTLALRALPVRAARRLARLLHRAPLAILTHPVVAAALDTGGLWVLYRTDLYTQMHTNAAVHVLVHLHVLLAGYLFTFAVLGGPDPAPHRVGLAWRGAVLALAIAAHSILAKTLYAHPPPGVPVGHAHDGSQLMYYGGLPIEIVLVVLLCRAWLRGDTSGWPPRRRGRLWTTRLVSPTCDYRK